MMPHSRPLLHLALMACIGLMAVAPARAASAPYQTGLVHWDAATNGFAGWARSGVVVTPAGALQLDPQTAAADTDPYAPGGYYGHNFYNGGAFLVGMATSPVVTPGFGVAEAIGSWNADTPAGTWIETQVRAQIGSRWTKWYNLGVWAADTGTVERHSVNAQGDADGTVATDTLLLEKSKPPASALQLRLRLFTTDHAVLPVVQRAALASSTSPQKPRQLTPGDPSRWNTALAVPACSQMVYADGGEVWCSPTSTSMVLGYWENDPGPCEPRVRAAVAGVYDWLYNGHGNWPFNTAYAATHNLSGHVARFTSMAQAEAWIAAGVPVIISYAWKNGELTGAPIRSSNGHLAVLIGFDAAGNPIVNDPAAPGDATVRRTYQRAQLESLWLEHSGGTVYLIYPPGWPVPTP
jgi:hypothetical protein